MIDQLTDILVDQAKAAVRKGAAFAAIAIVMLIGAGFLLAAIYMAIAARLRLPWRLAARW